jgi:hypothetical protein
MPSTEFPKLTTRELLQGTSWHFLALPGTSWHYRPIPRTCLFPRTSISQLLFGPTPIQAAAFLEQIKSASRLASPEFLDSKMWHLQASHMQNSPACGFERRGKQEVRFQHSPSRVHHPGNRLCQSGYLSVPPDTRVPAPDKDPELTF